MIVYADDKNKKHFKFNSKFHCPNSSAVNAFSCDWSNDFNWLCPPISLIRKTIKHARDCKCRGVLFVPFWKSAYYWPLLTSDWHSYFEFVKYFLVLDPFYFSPYFCKTPFKVFARFKALALYIDFS